MEYKLITERIHLYCPNAHICFAAELTRPADEKEIRTAIEKTIRKHPVLWSCVRMDGSGNSFLRIEEYAEAEFHVETASYAEDWLAVVAREQSRPFDLSRAPLDRFTCISGKHGMMLVICMHHILADGMSGIKILRDIAYFIKNPHCEAEVIADGLLENALLCPGEKLPLSVKLLTGWLNRRWRKAPHVFHVPEYIEMQENYWKRKSPAVQSHVIEAASLGRPLTEKMVKQCRESGVTVNTLLITTFLKSVQEISGRVKANKKAGIAISVHPNETAIGNFASATSVEYMYDGRKSVWENARIVQEMIRKKLANNNRKTFYLTFLKSLDPNLIHSMYFGLFGGFKNGASETLAKLLGYVPEPVGGGITNLGKSGLTIDDGIKTLYFVPPLVPSTDKIVGAVTTDTGLRLVYQYDHGENKKENRRIFEDWIGILERI